MRLRALFLLTGAAAGLLAQSGNFYSVKKETELGKQLREELKRKNELLQCAAVQAYVEPVGTRIAATMPNAPFPFVFEVMKGGSAQEVHEAVVLPAGYIFVRSGVFGAAADGAEFAAMLAHAMAQSVMRHPTRMMSRTAIVKFQSIPAGTAAPGPVSHYRQLDEDEADFVALKALKQTGFDPAALLRYIERVQRTDKRARVEKLRKWLVDSGGAANSLDDDIPSVRAEVLKAVER